MTIPKSDLFDPPYFFTPADIRFMREIGLDPAAFLKYSRTMRCFMAGPGCCYCTGERKLNLMFQDVRGMRCARCPNCMLEDILAWLRQDPDENAHSVQFFKATRPPCKYCGKDLMVYRHHPWFDAQGNRILIKWWAHRPASGAEDPTKCTFECENGITRATPEGEPWSAAITKS